MYEHEMKDRVTVISTNQVIIRDNQLTKRLLETIN